MAPAHYVRRKIFHQQKRLSRKVNISEEGGVWGWTTYARLEMTPQSAQGN